MCTSVALLPAGSSLYPCTHLLPIPCRDEILGTTLKDFRQFADVLAAVKDKGQVVAVTSGEWPTPLGNDMVV